MLLGEVDSVIRDVGMNRFIRSFRLSLTSLARVLPHHDSLCHDLHYCSQSLFIQILNAKPFPCLSYVQTWKIVMYMHILYLHIFHCIASCHIPHCQAIALY